MKNTKAKTLITNILIILITASILFGICFIKYIQTKNKKAEIKKTTITVSGEKFLDDFENGNVTKISIDKKTKKFRYRIENTENLFVVENPDISALEDAICESDVEIVYSNFSDEGYTWENIGLLLLFITESLFVGLLVCLIWNVHKRFKKKRAEKELKNLKSDKDTDKRDNSSNDTGSIRKEIECDKKSIEDRISEIIGK